MRDKRAARVELVACVVVVLIVVACFASEYLAKAKRWPFDGNDRDRRLDELEQRVAALEARR